MKSIITLFQLGCHMLCVLAQRCDILFLSTDKSRSTVQVAVENSHDFRLPQGGPSAAPIENHGHQQVEYGNRLDGDGTGEPIPPNYDEGDALLSETLGKEPVRTRAQIVSHTSGHELKALPCIHVTLESGTEPNIIVIKAAFDPC
jgi:hypothetical protein